jgi:hypothetical protein
MFDKTVVTTLTLDATTGLATAIAKSEAKDLVAGTIAGITSNFTKDEVVTGMGRTLATAVLVYGSAQMASKGLQGQFALNPYKAG